MSPRLGLTRGRWLRLLPTITLAFFLLPVLAGLAGTLLPALGIQPGAGTRMGDRSSILAPWDALLGAPELPGALLASLVSGLTATLLSFVAAVGISAGLQGTRIFGWIRQLLAPLLAVPHAALAIGFAFLISPSGWLIRLAAPLLASTGFLSNGLPPGLALPGDRYGLSLAAGLWLKETPFLLLAVIGGLNQIPTARSLTVARLLGYRPATAWLKVVLPPLYRQLRLPIYAVLAFSLSTVDMALVLGPSAPPTLAALLLRWFQDPGLSGIAPASAGGLLQLLLVAAAILVWRLGEAFVAKAGRAWLEGGSRGHGGSVARGLGAGTALLLLLAVAGSLLALALWSFTRRWPFPAPLPGEWGLANWQAAGPDLVRALLTSLLLALGSTILALALTLGCLENERRNGLHPTARALWLIYIPLLIPQISFLSGTVALFAWLGLGAGLPALVWSHLLFVLPCVFLMLADPYRAMDERFRRTGLCLGASPGRVFATITLPMLLRPILLAFAVGFAVSAALYLPTVFAGAGRFATLATEAVAANAGADRRLAGAYAMLQAVLPLAVFALALGLPRLVFRHRRGLRVARGGGG